MSDKWKEAFKAEITPDYRSRVLGSVEPVLASHAREKASVKGWLWRWPAGLGLAGAMALAVVFLVDWRQPEMMRDAELMVYEPAMVRDAELLQELQLLEAWDKQEQQDAKKWPKKKG